MSLPVHTIPTYQTIIQITDPHLFRVAGTRLLNVDTEHSLDGVIAHVQAHESTADMVLVTGDIAQEPGTEPYHRALEKLRPLGGLLRGLPGNHDECQMLYDTWAEHTHTITDLGRWRIVLLNSVIAHSNAGHLNATQLDLLAHACNTASGRHVLVAMHHNPIPMGSLWLDPMMINNSPALFTLIQQYPEIRALVWGHVHQAFDSVCSLANSPLACGPQHEVRLLSCPSTSVQFMPHSTGFKLDSVDPGYRRLRLHNDGVIDTTVIRVPNLGLHPALDSSGY